MNKKHIINIKRASTLLYGALYLEKWSCWKKKGDANGDADAVLHFPSRWKHCYLLRNLPLWAGGKNNKTTTKHLKFEAGLRMGLSLQRQIQKWGGWFMPSFRAGNTHSRRTAARVVDCQMAWRPREKAKCHASAKENHGLKRVVQFQHPNTINNSKQFNDLYYFIEKLSIYCLRQKKQGVLIAPGWNGCFVGPSSSEGPAQQDDSRSGLSIKQKHVWNQICLQLLLVEMWVGDPALCERWRTP